MKKTTKIISFIFLLAITLLAGCVVSQAKVSQNEAVSPNEGLLLIQSDRSWLKTERDEPPLMEVYYRPFGSSVNTGQVTFVHHENFFLAKVPAGKYELHQISYVGGYIRFPAATTFTVEAGKTTYIGNFQLDVTWSHFFNPTHLKIVDQEDDAIKQYNIEYPGFPDRFPLINQVPRIEIN